MDPRSDDLTGADLKLERPNQSLHRLWHVATRREFYNPITATAFSLNTLLSLIYLRSTAIDLCPVV